MSPLLARATRCLLAAALLLPAGCKRKNKNPFLSTPPAGTTGVSLAIQSVDVTQSPMIKVMVQVVDTATNKILSNTGFKLGDFSILEDGKPVVPTEVTPEPNLPLAIVLVIDRSGSMSTEDRNQAATDAALALVSGLDGSELVAYVEFDDVVTTKVNFTNDAATLANAISAGEPGGSTAFFDAVTTGAELFSQVSGRKNILIALGDGDDNSSTNTLESAKSTLSSRGVTAFTVVLGMDITDTSNFSQLATSTNGTFFQSADGSDLVAYFPSVPRLFVNLIGIKYRRRSNGDLTVFLNWGGLTASSKKQFTS